MAYKEVIYPAEKDGFYALLREQVELYTKDSPDLISALANASAVIKLAFSEANWVGFYLVDGDGLRLGPFQGRPAVPRIGYGLGVCGTAWKRREAIAVEEVACFEGHIACDCNTHSELVVPLFAGGEVCAVLDMDSTVPAYFGEEDKRGMEEVGKVVERYF